jgi:hypothetical protein
MEPSEFREERFIRMVLHMRAMQKGHMATRSHKFIKAKQEAEKLVDDYLDGWTNLQKKLFEK